MDWTFNGYRRLDGRVGVRNHLLVIPTSVTACTVARRIAASLSGAVAICHEHGIGQERLDAVQTHRILANTGKSPNVGGVLVVGVDQDDQIPPVFLAQAIAATGKPVRWLTIREAGGTLKAIDWGTSLLAELAVRAAECRREPFPASMLVIGSKCGGSDATSGLASNPGLGAAMDVMIREAGATVLFSETPEIIGAEHLVAARAASPEVAADVFAIAEKFEQQLAVMGVDMRGGNPTRGNIAGGLSSIEEKSLGCISKGGTTPLLGVTRYGDAVAPTGGLYFMDSASNDIECVSGMVAAGCQIVCFTTGQGTPCGAAGAPVMKLCANPETCGRMRDNIDVDLSPVLRGRQSLEAAGMEIARYILRIASGELVKAEVLGHTEFSITRLAYSM